MDKNFINIDDLVRQRLGGGEEREQAGSWGRMSDLLDKEMPQRPAAGIYWRRSLSALLLLLLVAGVSIGGYELANRHTAATAGAGIAAMTPPAMAANTTAGESTSPDNTAANATAATASNTPDHNTNSNNSTGENKSMTIVASGAAKESGTEAKPDAASAPVRESRKRKATAASAAPKTIAVNNNKNIQKPAGKKEGKIALNNSDAVKHDKVQPVNEKHADGKNEKVANPVTAGIAAANSKTGNEQTPAADSKETMEGMPLSSSAPALAGNVNNNKHGKTHGKKAHRQAIAPTAKTTAVAVNNTAPAATPAVSEPVASSGVAGSVAKKGHKSAKQGSGPIAAGKPAGTGATASSQPVLSATTNTGRQSSKAVVKATPHKMQKQVQRVVLAQHLVQVSPTEARMVFDTISMESIMEDYDIVMAPPAFGPQTYERFIATSDETNTAVVAKDSHPKMKKGSSSMENLNAAFNDMKNKVKGAHFAPGLTAGINGTFFGPNSFRGFQFGVTGKVTFSETLAIMSELKYFHRINNNYALSDDYYTYTPVAAGGYTRTLVVNPYAFSTLHSIELPISVRYCTGNFNFFVGGNFDYSFAINTGAYPLADPTTATQVSAVGNDNAPKVKDEDFGSRFGFGYLVGASYQVTPNLMIDFRNVQNIWDNSKSSGSKIVSGQLYKSPSLQLSIGYRLGGNKRNKE